MSWIILDKPEEMRLDGEPIWVFAKHTNGRVCYRMKKFDAENSISGIDGLTYGTTTTNATPITYRPYKRIPDVRGQKLRLKRCGMELIAHTVSDEKIWLKDFCQISYQYTTKEAFDQLEYLDGTPFGEVEE